jgi:hypothetical protein
MHGFHPTAVLVQYVVIPLPVQYVVIPLPLYRDAGFCSENHRNLRLTSEQNVVPAVVAPLPPGQHTAVAAVAPTVVVPLSTTAVQGEDRISDEMLWSKTVYPTFGFC